MPPTVQTPQGGKIWLILRHERKQKRDVEIEIPSTEARRVI